jgi:hypothetical protein
VATLSHQLKRCSRRRIALYAIGDTLEADSTVSILEIVQKEGKREVSHSLEFYSLDMIIAVGYTAKPVLDSHHQAIAHAGATKSEAAPVKGAASL